jgi:hypothetical protein
MNHKKSKSIRFSSTLRYKKLYSPFSAYIDPNTGGMLFQLLAILFGLFSGLFLFFSSQIKKAFYRGMRTLRGKNSEEETETGAKTEG